MTDSRSTHRYEVNWHDSGRYAPHGVKWSWVLMRKENHCHAYAFNVFKATEGRKNIILESEGF